MSFASLKETKVNIHSNFISKRVF